MAAASKRSCPVPATKASIRDELVEQARRRIASGYYDSDVCLGITVRRLVRELKRSGPTVMVIPQRSHALPGRSAQKQAAETSKVRRGRSD